MEPEHHDMEIDTETAHSRLRRTPRDFKFTKDPGSTPPVKFHYKVGHCELLLQLMMMKLM